MTAMIEVLSTRTSGAKLQLTICARYFDPSEVEVLESVLDKTDRRTKKFGKERRLRGYALGALVDAVVTNQLGASDAAEATSFVREYVRSTFDDPDGDYVGESFDEENFDWPDDVESPESSFVIDRFIKACGIQTVHRMDSAEARAAAEAVQWKWSELAIDRRPHFVLALELAAESHALLFDGQTWSSAYSLRS